MIIHALYSKILWFRLLREETPLSKNRNPHLQSPLKAPHIKPFHFF